MRPVLLNFNVDKSIPVNNRHSETETYGEVGAEPGKSEPTEKSNGGGKSKSGKRHPTDNDKNLLLSSDDEFQ